MDLEWELNERLKNFREEEGYIMVIKCQACSGMLGLFEYGNLRRQAEAIKRWMALHRNCVHRGAEKEQKRRQERVVKAAERIIKKAQEDYERRQFVEEIKRILRGEI